MISVVIPVYNEEGSLEQLHAELAAVFSSQGGVTEPVEFVFVDDGSRDGSWPVLTRLLSVILEFAAFGSGGTSARRPR